MEIISIHKSQKLDKLLPQLRKNHRIAQKALYDGLSRKMLGVCRGYVTDFHHAEDCMLRAFVKVFKNIDTYKSEGSFEGWIRRIMVNECLDFLKQSKSMIYLEEMESAAENSEIESDLTGIDAQDLLDKLPESYRTVFNLFVLEEFSHREIAVTLNISETASKTQLLRAKKKLKDLILQQKRMAK